jgi:lipopolysaccharide/colanic/teichoic acid biosynthesis glycosyltransferase
MSTLLKDKIPVRTYRHFSLPPALESKKLEFFYVGKRTALIDMLISSFDSGYAAENADQAKTMLKRLLSRSTTCPDVIIADAALGPTSLNLFGQFLASHNQLSAVPYIIEGSGISGIDLKKLAAERTSDDIVLLEELGAERFIRKIRFWKKVKERISREQQPVSEESSSQPTINDFTKRVFDIVLSVALMVLLSPLFLLVIIALKLESRGPIFYTSKRAGKGYNIFTFYKFRTMIAGSNDRIADLAHLNMYNPLKENGPVFIKIDNDPRVTRLGAFLRKCSLDELPQLWNVFRGDMSLVGNRPLPLYEAATLTTDEWAKRFMAPAGITGLWQINKKRKFKMSAEERISLDINYADKSNFLFDLWIMANTPSAVIQRTNA